MPSVAMIRRFCFAALASSLAAVTPSRADSPAGHCTLSVTSVAFGTYYPLSGGDARTTEILTYNCSVSRPIAIVIAHGSSPNPLDRLLKFKGERAHYNLYLDAATTMVWGDGTDGSQLYRDPAPPPNVNVSIPVFSRMPAGQREAVGLYDDQVTVQLTY